MKLKSYATWPAILLLLLLIAISTTAGCASGTPKIEAWKFNQEAIHEVRTNCSDSFPDATDGKFVSLWKNKRDILKQSRACSRAATVLADQAENRNKVLGN